MSTPSLAKRNAVVTGGAAGIGYAICERLLADGAKVLIWDADRKSLDVATRNLAKLGAVFGDVVDVADPIAVEHMASRADAQLGTIDILVHCAGISGPNATVADYPVAEWRRVIDVDLSGTFYVNQAVVRRMIARGFGRIVNVASVAGKEGNPNASAYSAAKAGVIGFTKSLGKETAHLNIAVNCITPAVVKTGLLGEMTQEHIDYMLSKIPRKRFLEAAEIASMVAWLVSDENSFTTGAVFDISGGRATY
jgi:2-dehydro-3-deoxy-L-rhamnonate dehydrogenase (NAD+)